MYYYQHNIGDFDKKTRHLTRVERSIYLDLIHLYYTTEQQLPVDIAMTCRKVLARSEEEKSAVLAILDEFFTETPNGWFHERCEEELEVYRKSNSQKSIAGKASAAARAKKLEDAINASPTSVPTTVATDDQRAFNGIATNQEPITSNHKPVTKNQEPGKSKAPASGSRLPADWKPDQADIDYCKTERPELLPSKVAQNFYDYWIAIPGAKGRKLDWSATWRGWVRKESAAIAGRAGASPSQPKLTLSEQNARNNEEAKRLLEGRKPMNSYDEMRTIDV